MRKHNKELTEYVKGYLTQYGIIDDSKLKVYLVDSTISIDYGECMLHFGYISERNNYKPFGLNIVFDPPTEFMGEMSGVKIPDLKEYGSLFSHIGEVFTKEFYDLILLQEDKLMDEQHLINSEIYDFLESKVKFEDLSNLSKEYLNDKLGVS